MRNGYNLQWSDQAIIDLQNSRDYFLTVDFSASVRLRVWGGELSRGLTDIVGKVSFVV